MRKKPSKFAQVQSTIVCTTFSPKILPEHVGKTIILCQTKGGTTKNAEKETQRHRVSKLTNLRHYTYIIIRERKPKQVVDKTFIYGSDDEP